MGKFTKLECRQLTVLNSLKLKTIPCVRESLILRSTEVFEGKGPGQGIYSQETQKRHFMCAHVWKERKRIPGMERVGKMLTMDRSGGGVNSILYAMLTLATF